MIKSIHIILSIVLSFTLSFANLFFSEYAEGTSNNKYLEIYNSSDQSVDLSQYSFPNSNNTPDVPGAYDYWNMFDEGATINAGDVYVLCHGSADDFIQAQCDQSHTRWRVSHCY